MAKQKRKTYEELQRENMELRAQMMHSQKAALRGIDKAHTDCLMASCAIVTITGLGGRVICAPFAVLDGFSQETIDAMKADIRKSIALSS